MVAVTGMLAGQRVRILQYQLKLPETVEMPALVITKHLRHSTIA
jgi:hypothetical protein